MTPMEQKRKEAYASCKIRYPNGTKEERSIFVMQDQLPRC